MFKNAFSISKRLIGPLIYRRVGYDPKLPLYLPKLSSTEIVSSSAPPVPIRVFYKRLRTLLWGQSPRSGQPKPVRLGLAISGGVDSMALASLVKRSLDGKGHKNKANLPDGTWQQPRNFIRAFIVDHGLREESALEVAWVRKILSSMGMSDSTS